MLGSVLVAYVGGAALGAALVTAMPAIVVPAVLVVTAAAAICDRYGTDGTAPSLRAHEMALVPSTLHSGEWRNCQTRRLQVPCSERDVGVQVPPRPLTYSLTKPGFPT